MRLLIDTHILLWADERPRRIAPALLAAMRDETNEIAVSAATIWEIAIKRAIGNSALIGQSSIPYFRSASGFCLWPALMPSMPEACRRIIMIRSIG